VEALPTSDSVAEAGEKAGYAYRQDAHRALKGIAERAPEVLERLGLTIEHVADKCLRPLLEAKKEEFFADKGIVLTTKEVAALDIRIRAIDVCARLMGAYAGQKVKVSGGLSLDFNHATDDELDHIRALAEAVDSDAREPGGVPPTVAAGAARDSLVAANWRFHRAVHRASGSPRILTLIRQTVGVVPTNFFDVFPDRGQHSASDHHELVAALARRDGPAARAAAERHVTDAGAALARFLEQGSRRRRIAR